MRFASGTMVVGPDGKPVALDGVAAVFLDARDADKLAKACGPGHKLQPVRVVTDAEGMNEACRTVQMVDLVERREGEIGLMELARQSHEIARSKGFDGQTVPESMSLFHSEVSEAFEEWRNGRGMHEVYEGVDGKPEGYPIELADLQIRLAHHVAEHGIDIVGAIRRKSAYNRNRPFRHGKKI